MQFKEREQNGVRRILDTTNDILRTATQKCAEFGNLSIKKPPNRDVCNLLNGNKTNYKRK